MAYWSDTDKPQPAKGVAEPAGKMVATIKNWQQDSRGLVSSWRNDQVKWHKLRMRIKKEKTFPFPGCSNIRMPTLDIVIKKVKAGIMSIIFGLSPIVQAEPTPGGDLDTAKKIEKFLDHLITDVINFQEKAMIAVDRSLEKGFYLFKPYWRTEIRKRIKKKSLDEISLKQAISLYSLNRNQENVAAILKKWFDVDMHPMVLKHNRQELLKAADDILSAEEKVELELQDVTYNFPDVALAQPERIYVPTTTGFDPQDAQYIIHEFFEPYNMIVQNAEQKNWNVSSVEKIGESRHLELEQIDSEKDDREGIERIQETSENLVKVWECFCWYDINGDGEKEKAVVTVAPEFNVVLRKVSLPFYSGKFPIVKLFYELTDDRWFSHRGIPEILEDIVKEIDVQHMQKIDSQTIRNAPMFLYRAGMVNPKAIQFEFGQGIPVNGMQPLDDLIKPFQATNTNAEFSYEREQQILEAKVQEFTGRIDFTLQSMINKREPRKATEVGLQNKSAQSVFKLDADTYRSCFERLFNWIWDLWCQYGDDSYEFSYFGEEGWENIKLSKEEIQGDYKIKIRGNDQNTNPQVKLQKAQMILAGMQNEVGWQTGILQPENLYNAYKRYFQNLDIPEWRDFVTDPRKAKQIMAQRQQQQAQQDQKEILDNLNAKFSDLSPGEQAQVLQKMGIKPDVASRLLDKWQELGKGNAEIQSKLRQGGQGGQGLSR